MRPSRAAEVESSVPPADARPRGLRRRGPRRPRPDAAYGFPLLRARLDDLRAQAQGVVDEYIPQDVQKEAHRKGFHMVAGIVATPLVLYTGTCTGAECPVTQTGLWYTTVAAIVTLVVIASLELLMSRFDVAVPFLTKQLTSTRRPNETFSWASTMFLVAALAILWIAPLPVAFAALAMLGLGDGMSALVGRAIGRHRLWWNPKKSLEGSLAGFLAGALGALLLTGWYYAAIEVPFPMLAVVPIAVAGSLAAMVAESMPQWEDNFSVPIASSATMMVLWLTAGLEPRSGPLVEFVISGRWWPL